MRALSVRKWAIRWLYAVAAAHLAVGLLLTWGSNMPLFDNYHRLVESAFWPIAAPEAGHRLEVWWLSLFGPTIQAVGIWLAALAYMGERYRSVGAWYGLLLGFAIWAPQDILISLRADIWVHVWADLLALLSVVPVLCWLAWNDRGIGEL